MPYPICPHSNIIPLIEMKQVPVYCNVLWPSYEQAIAAARGDIKLGYFSDCGHVYNLAFDASLMDYTTDYENSLHFSPRFQQYATDLAQRLIDQYDLHDKDIIDVGAGKGDFLLMMADMGNNRGWGFDPSYEPAAGHTAANVTFIQDYYSEKYTSYKADFIACRHVLEHIEQPDEFVQLIRRTVGHRQETIVFFEVPNSLYTLRQLGIWDIIYEHCSYFSPASLARVFHQNGFQVLQVAETFGGQFLTIETKLHTAETAVSTRDDAEALAELADYAHAFADSFQQKLVTWQDNLARMRQQGQTAVVWGAGSKGVTFMNMMQANDVITHVVDINPRKQGKFVAGSGQQIVTPTALQTLQPDAIIVMNPNYTEEIRQMVHELDLQPVFTFA